MNACNSTTFKIVQQGVEEDRGKETRGKGGGRREKKEGKNYPTLRNMHNAKMQRVGANKYRAGTGIKGYGKRPTRVAKHLQLV